MQIKSIKLENYTVFQDISISFNKGINVFIGENATGKTHLMKVLYSACMTSRKDTDFGNKIVRTTLPDDFRLSRLLTRMPGNRTAIVKVGAINEQVDQTKYLSILFDNKTKRWNGIVKGKETWEKTFENDLINFIPAKEMLSHSYQLAAAASVGNVRFDDTYIDIINSAKVDISMGKDSDTKKRILRKIEDITGGKVKYDSGKDEFYLKQGRANLEFNLVAEGLKKSGLLWILAKNGTLERGSVLFWDEPEANLNPKSISIIAEILLELQNNGVQIFVATHDYFLAKYLDIFGKKGNESNQISYYSLYRSRDDGTVKCEQAEEFTLLTNNPIVYTYLQVYRDEVMS